MAWPKHNQERHGWRGEFRGHEPFDNDPWGNAPWWEQLENEMALVALPDPPKFMLGDIARVGC
jgi:hypothetical protein